MVTLELEKMDWRGATAWRGGYRVRNSLIAAAICSAWVSRAK